MEILVLGNGFDLAHRLPTKYGDFLSWIIAEYNLYRNLVKERPTNNLLKHDVHLDIPEELKNDSLKVARSKKQHEIWKSLDNNIWIEYFLTNPIYQNENWIDFENEISRVIQSIGDIPDNDFDNPIYSLKIKFYRVKFTNDIPEFLNLTSPEEQEKYSKPQITFKNFKERLLLDLNKLIYALEIYLCNYVAKKLINVISPDIKSIQPDKVLNFNYTETFKKLYGKDKDIDYDYIHGKADIDHTIETNNMVLGIDEYLTDQSKNNDTNYIEFKKYYQRIHKETGCKYRDWIDEIQREYIYIEKQREANEKGHIYPVDIGAMVNSIAASVIKRTNCKIHNLYIFGHSLDFTDKDILRDLILNDNIHTTIYYYNKEVYGQQIKNLVRVIGQDELIKRTGGPSKTITFKKQQKMVKCNVGLY